MQASRNLQACLLRDSQGRWQFAIAEDSHGLYVRKIADSDAMDDRELICAGDRVLAVAGHTMSGVTLDAARQRVKDHPADQLHLELRRLLPGVGEQQLAAAEAAEEPVVTASLLRDSAGRWMFAIGENEHGLFLSKLGASDAMDERELLLVGDRLVGIGGRPVIGLTLEAARQEVKMHAGASLELQVRRAPERPPVDDVAERVERRMAARAEEVATNTGARGFASAPQPRSPMRPGTDHDRFLEFAMRGTGVPPPSR